MIESLRPEVTTVYALQRYALHVFLSASIYLLTFRVFYWIIGKLHWERMRGWWALIAPAIFIYVFIVGREVYDVAHGDPIWKSFTDWSSWLVGFGLVIWGIYRLTPLFMEILCEIDSRRYAKQVKDSLSDEGKLITMVQDFSVDPSSVTVRSERDENGELRVCWEEFDEFGNLLQSKEIENITETPRGWKLNFPEKAAGGDLSIGLYSSGEEVVDDDSMVDGEHGSGKDDTGKSTGEGKSDGSS